MKQQKKIVRRREKVFRKYRLQSCWTTLVRERKKYRKILFDAKTVCYSKKVEDCKGDVKGLYRMVNTLMGTSSEYPLPNHTSDKDLAEEFADFFMVKITTRLAAFRPFEQTEVKKIIFGMKSKSCELDALPTRLLKQCIEDILPTITNLVNIHCRRVYLHLNGKPQS